jgi:hypothetical protein
LMSVCPLDGLSLNGINPFLICLVQTILPRKLHHEKPD